MDPSDLIEKHFPRLSAEKKSALRKLRIHTIRDLIFHFPARYETAGKTGTIAGVSVGADVTLFGTIRKPETRKTWKSRRAISEAFLEDASGRIKLMWFSQPYIAKMLTDGMVVKVTGRVGGTEGKEYLPNPEVDTSPISPEKVHDTLFVKGEAQEQTLYPVYPESKGVSSLWFLHAMKRVFSARAHEKIEEYIPEDLLKEYKLPSLAAALVYMHAPKQLRDAEVARKRFAFSEVFLLQLAMNQEKQNMRTERALSVSVNEKMIDSFVSSFPFKATEAQKQTIKDITDDFKKGYPMRRLLEGDVGSGKTAVAATTAYAVATSLPPNRNSGTLQVAYMCPTEILAKQHFSTFVSYFKDHPISIGLITGSECRKFPSKVNGEESTRISRAQFQKWVLNGEIPIVIGTHALVYNSLSFKYLAYVIIDEQHRFGTLHRQKLTKKTEYTPHLLSMTATPIPRTLALTVYGDLDLSLLDQMPLGRKPIITEVLSEKEREKAYMRARAELQNGRQVYVICPRIEEPDPAKQLALQAKSVKAEAERLKKEVFQDAEIEILHSKMTPTEKEQVMKRFEDGEVNVLVATSVVEVGVNVPNATVILIEGAERFGLAQLHQLRGRVIRSNHQAYCFFLPETFGKNTRERMRALVNAKNGFELAEYDLQLRGAGELTGARQWGVSDMAMEALRNIKLVEAAKKSAYRILEKDPTLASYPLLKHIAEETAKNIHPE